MRINVDQLPKTARMLADVIGLPATLALVDIYGGLSIWPAKTGADRAALGEIIGEEAAQRFVDTFREEVTIPKCVSAIRAVMHTELRAEFDRLTGEGASARSTVKQLALRYRYTVRWVWYLLNETDADGEVMDVQQGELF